LAALVLLLVARRGRALYVAVIAMACLAGPVALAQLLWAPRAQVIGTVLAATAVVVVYLAPRATILLARLPIPRVPTAGEPLDEIETQGGVAVEGVSALGKQIIPTGASLVDHVGRARDQLAGILSAAAVLAVIGCYEALPVGGGMSWQATLFTVAVATVLCLRGRSHHDLVQSATLIGAGLLIAVAVVAKTATHAEGWRLDSALALSALMGLLVVCGLVAPSIEFSPLSRRWTEILEFVAIVLVFPLACSIMHVYGVFRDLRV
jgi:type VII secretion integral membrane protein EccD